MKRKTKPLLIVASLLIAECAEPFLLESEKNLPGERLKWWEPKSVNMWD